MARERYGRERSSSASLNYWKLKRQPANTNTAKPAITPYHRPYHQHQALNHRLSYPNTPPHHHTYNFQPQPLLLDPQSSRLRYRERVFEHEENDQNFDKTHEDDDQTTRRRRETNHEFVQQQLFHKHEERCDLFSETDDGFTLVKNRKRQRQVRRLGEDHLKASEYGDTQRRLIPGTLVQTRVPQQLAYDRKNRDFERTPALVSRAGNRGVPRHPWWRGPREPPQSSLGSPLNSVVSLFVDGIARVTTISEIRKLFESCGVVHDVYISGKKRSNTNFSFGFVKFRNKNEALNGIQKLDGFTLNGSTLSVSMAKYQRGGAPVIEKKAVEWVNTKAQMMALKSASRDHRKYADVLMGKASHIPQRVEQQDDSIQTVRVLINTTAEERMSKAVVVEHEQTMETKEAAEIISGMNIKFSYMSAISPFKIIVFFDDENEVKKAIDESSPLRSLFSHVRVWTDDECYDDRLVWVECCGIHPKFWSLENFEKIGEQWGKTLKVDQVFHEANYLTAARILIHTQKQEKIEGKLRLEWDKGSSIVWVREVGVGDGSSFFQQLHGNVNSDDKVEEDNSEKSNTNSTQRVSNTQQEVMKLPQDNKASEFEDPLIQCITSKLGDVSCQEHFDPMAEFEATTTQNICVHSNDRDDEHETAQGTAHNAAQSDSNGDPMAEFEAQCVDQCVRGIEGEENILVTPVSRPRGRPKRATLLHRNALSANQAPTTSLLEAETTWNLAKSLGIKSANEEAVLVELRKSKRLMMLEERAKP